jgi:hypothetical protein
VFCFLFLIFARYSPHGVQWDWIKILLLSPTRRNNEPQPQLRPPTPPVRGSFPLFSYSPIHLFAHSPIRPFAHSPIRLFAYCLSSLSSPPSPGYHAAIYSWASSSGPFRDLIELQTDRRPHSHEQITLPPSSAVGLTWSQFEFERRADTPAVPLRLVGLSYRYMGLELVLGPDLDPRYLSSCPQLSLMTRFVSFRASICAVIHARYLPLSKSHSSAHLVDPSPTASFFIIYPCIRPTLAESASVDDNRPLIDRVGTRLKNRFPFCSFWVYSLPHGTAGKGH